MQATSGSMRKTRLFATATAITALTLMGLVTPRPARADATAVSFLQPYVQWAQAQPNGPGTYGLQIVMVSNRPDQVASYAENGFLAFSDVWVWPYLFVDFSGNAEQYFSNRRFNCDTSLLATNPFNPNATDLLGINLDAIAGTATFTFKSWGNIQRTADLHAANGVLIGTFADGRGGPTTVVLSVQPAFHSMPQ